eukprot:5915723-Pleurochrysis_carterae.AAC.1
MRRNLQHFAPVDAVDAGHFKGKGSGERTTTHARHTQPKRTQAYTRVKRYLKATTSKQTHRDAGTLCARATYDANRCVHPMAVAHILCGECTWGYQNMMEHEKLAYGDKVIGKHRVAIVDGGTSLKYSLKAQHPENTTTRCSRHLSRGRGEPVEAQPIAHVCTGGYGRAQRF